MIFKELTPNHPDIPAVKKLFEESFPENERTVSMDVILANLKLMPIKRLGIYPEETPDTFAGFFLTAEGKTSVYLTYLAICPEQRSGGIGGKAMSAIREYYKGKTLLFSYESPFEESDNAEQRERRRKFHLRNGFYETGWFAKLNGTEFIIACSKEDFDKDEFLSSLASMVPEGAPIPELYRRD